MVKYPNDIVVALALKTQRALSAGSFLPIVWALKSVAESGWPYLFAPKLS